MGIGSPHHTQTNGSVTKGKKEKSQKDTQLSRQAEPKPHGERMKAGVEASPGNTQRAVGK